MSIYPNWTLGDLDLCQFPFAVEFGSDNGTPQNIAEVIESYLLDGEFVLSDSTSNRTIVLPVMIDDADMAALADAEALLVAECNKPFNRLRIDPGDGFGAATDFQTFRAQVEFRRSDNEEINGVRRYLLTIPALPQAFSTTVTVTPALTTAAVPSTTTISDGTSATGWTGDFGPPTVVSGELRVDLALQQYGGDPYVWGIERVLTYTGSVDMSTTPYLSIDVRYDVAAPSGDFGYGLSCAADGVSLNLISMARTLDDTVTYTFECPDPSVSTFRFTLVWAARFYSPYSSAPTAYAFVDNLTRTDSPPWPNSTSREQVRSLSLAGSVRTPGTLEVSHPTSALGDVLVHTCPDFGTGFQPGTMHFRTAGGGVSTGQPTVSGRLASGSITLDVPINGMPRGTYAVVIRARKNTGTVSDESVTFEAQGLLGANIFGPAVTGGTTFAMESATYAIATLGTLELPTCDVAPQSDALQRIEINSSLSADLRTDQVWLFFLGDHLGNRGHLTQVSCGTAAPSAGGSSNRLWLRSATVDRPLPSVLVGYDADMTDAHFAADALWDQHEFTPGGMVVTTVTTNAESAEVSFESRAAYHSHAAT